MMAFPTLRRSRTPPPAETVYARLVEGARAPALYRHLAVPDTLDGRFEMLVLHAVLFFRRLRSEDEAARRLGQEVFEAMFRDMDGSLRELGVGDLAVPKRIKGMIQAFYGRGAAYDAALDGEEARALEEALARNIYVGEGCAPAKRLAAYVRAAEAGLAAQSRATLTQSGPSFAGAAAAIEEVGQ
jgi:cytochrome b pre-mRNA-processing protein 3